MQASLNFFIRVARDCAASAIMSAFFDMAGLPLAGEVVDDAGAGVLPALPLCALLSRPLLRLLFGLSSLPSLLLLSSDGDDPFAASVATRHQQRQ